MSEEYTGALTGAGQGAATGASVGTMIAPGIGTAIGAGVGAIVGGIGGFIGGSKAKKRRQQIEAQINALTQKVGQSVRGRLQNMDKLTEAQKQYAEALLGDAMNQYAEMKLQYNGLYERNSQAAEENYGEELASIESALTEELGILDETFQEYQAGLDDLYAKERDFIQADLAHNDQLKEEFKTNADQAIKDTWEASNEAKIDLQQLKDSGGRPENFDRVVAENAKAFGDVQRQIERADAGRGRSDLTGKKMTALFKEAMQRGNLTGAMAEQGQQEERMLRDEIANRGGQAMNQAAMRAEMLKTENGQIMAELMNRYQGTKIESMLKQGMAELSATADSNTREMIAKQNLDNIQRELAMMRDQGLISAEEFQYTANQAAKTMKNNAELANWEYKDQEARQHEGAMKNTIAGLQGQAQQIRQENKFDMGKFLGNISSVAGAFGGDPNAFTKQEGYPSPFVSMDAANKSGYGTPYGPQQPTVNWTDRFFGGRAPAVTGTSGDGSVIPRSDQYMNFFGRRR